MKHSLEEYRKRKVVPTRLKYEDYFRTNSKKKSSVLTEDTTHKKET